MTEIKRSQGELESFPFSGHEISHDWLRPVIEILESVDNSLKTENVPRNWKRKLLTCLSSLRYELKVADTDME